MFQKNKYFLGCDDFCGFFFFLGGGGEGSQLNWDYSGGYKVNVQNGNIFGVC